MSIVQVIVPIQKQKTLSNFFLICVSSMKTKNILFDILTVYEDMYLRNNVYFKRINVITCYDPKMKWMKITGVDVKP